MMYFIIIVNALVCSSEVKILKIGTEKKPNHSEIYFIVWTNHNYVHKKKIQFNNFLCKYVKFYKEEILEIV